MLVAFAVGSVWHFIEVFFVRVVLYIFNLVNGQQFRHSENLI